MRVHGVVVPHPAIDQGESGSSIGDWVHPDVIALERLHQRLGHAVLSGLSTGVKPGTRLSAKAVSIVLWATKIDPLSESHCTGCGARISPKRFSTQSSIMSRIISPEIPAVVATQLITSRSWQSRAKARRTISPFKQVNSSASEHHR